VEPFVVLVILPVAIGALAEAAFRDARRASFTAAIGSAFAVGIVVQMLDRNESWSWVAAVLVSPLPIALAVGTVLFWYGRTTARRRPPA
jgi:cytochrome bd-type quinol oxidase subunit 2